MIRVNPDAKYLAPKNAHKIYKNSKGEVVPSVTTVIKKLDKPFLVKWANYMGFKRVKTEDVLTRSSTVGTIVHDMIENFIKTGATKMNYPEFNDNGIMSECINAFNGFKHWWNENKHRIEVIFLERELTCETYGGTIDFVCKIDGIVTIVDFKTSNNLSETMFIQLMAYNYLLKENGFEPAKNVAILKMSKTDIHYEYVEADVDKIPSFFSAFLNLLALTYDCLVIDNQFKQLKKGVIE